MSDLLSRSNHFDFGENWSQYAVSINDERIDEAKKSLLKLIPLEKIKGSRWLDIGSGSGLFSLAALLLGAKEVVAIDIDECSVETTQKILEKFAPQGAKYKAIHLSVFDLSQGFNQFDVIYSWGVLHHTGNMYKAIKAAVDRLEDDGLFAIALYKKTRFCGFWGVFKKHYYRCSTWAKSAYQYLYMFVFLVAKFLFKGQPPWKVIKGYAHHRGMSFKHDVHDWLGGYPYESISPDEMKKFSEKNDLVIERQYIQPISGGGIFGSICDEYVLKRSNRVASEN